MKNIGKTGNKSVRKIIKIDESKCTGCGLCVPSCAEGALRIINGKAKLVSEVYCDGLGACLGECPEGALTIEEREAAGFDETATEEHIKQMMTVTNDEQLPCASLVQNIECPSARHPGCGCPSAAVRCFGEDTASKQTPVGRGQPRFDEFGMESNLSHWPIQLTLVPAEAPFLPERDLVISADCVAYAYANFHRDFLKGNVVVIGCPKLDALSYYQDKLIDIFTKSGIKSVTVLHMEVPCCSGIVGATKKALVAANKTDIPAKEITIGIKGDIQCESSLF